MTISVGMQALAGVLVALGAYLIGNINNAVLISRMKGVDIRKLGSGNPGTMNMLRSVGKIAGVVTLTFDVLKGVIPCLLGWLFMGQGEFLRMGADRMGMYVAGFCAVLGHVYPVLYKFHGGKGAATIIGVCLTLQPLITLATFAFGVAFLFITKVGSITSFIIVCPPFTVEAVQAADNPLGIYCALILFASYMLSLFAHRRNLVMLFSGAEGRVLLTKKAKSKKFNIPEYVFESVIVTE